MRHEGSAGEVTSKSANATLARRAWRALTVMGIAALCVAGVHAQTSGAHRGDPIVIGQTTIKSGPLAALAIEPNRGIGAYIHQVNAAGGIRGRKIELLQLDDGYDPAKAANNVHQLAEAGAVAIISPIGTASSEGALKAARELGMVVVAPYTGADSVVHFGSEAVPIRISFSQEFERIVSHLYTVGQTRMVFVYNDNPGARAARDSTKAAVQKHGGALVADLAVAQDGSDAGAKAKQLAALRPNAVILALTNPVAAKFIPEFRKLDAAARFYSFSFLDGAGLHKAIGVSATGVVISQVVPSPWTSMLPVAAEYRRAIQALGGGDFSYASFEGFLAAKLLVQALRESGDAMSPAAVTRSLQQSRDRDLGGIVARSSRAAHPGLSFSELAMIREDGRFSR